MAKRYEKQLTRWSELRSSDPSKRYGVVAERQGNYYQIKHVTNKEENKYFCTICGRYHTEGLCGKEDVIVIKNKNIFKWLQKNKYTEE